MYGDKYTIEKLKGRVGEASSAANVREALDKRREGDCGSERLLTTAYIARIGTLETIIDTGAFRTFIKSFALVDTKTMKPWNGPVVERFGLPIMPDGTVPLTVREGTDVADVRKVGLVEKMPYRMLLGRDFLCFICLHRIGRRIRNMV